MANITITDTNLIKVLRGDDTARQGNVWTTAESGVAGIDALNTAAGTNIGSGDYGIIDSAGSPVLFRHNGEHWYRPNPWGEVAYTATPVSDTVIEQDPAAAGWTETADGTITESGGTITMTSGGAGGNSSFIDGPTNATTGSAGAYAIVEDIAVNVTAGSTTATCQFLVPGDYGGGTDAVINLNIVTNANPTTWRHQGQNTGIAFAGTNTLEIYSRDDGAGLADILIFENYAATPSYTENSAATPTTAITNPFVRVQFAGAETSHTFTKLFMGHLDPS